MNKTFMILHKFFPFFNFQLGYEILANNINFNSTGEITDPPEKIIFKNICVFFLLFTQTLYIYDLKYFQTP